MTKTVVVSDVTHKRLRKMGFAGLSLNDIISYMIDYVEQDLEDFDAFLEGIEDGEE